MLGLANKLAVALKIFILEQYLIPFSSWQMSVVFISILYYLGLNRRQFSLRVRILVVPVLANLSRTINFLHGRAQINDM